MSSCRVIQRIYTINDGRPDDSKPHANEIILSFWWLYLSWDITSIRSLFFCDVKEKTLKDAKRYVYAEMGNVDSRRPLAIRAGQGMVEEAQFDRLHYGTKFGRLAQRIVEAINSMTGVRLQVIEFMFLPLSYQQEEDEDSDSEEGEASQGEQVDERRVRDDRVNYHFKIFLG